MNRFYAKKILRFLNSRIISRYVHQKAKICGVISVDNLGLDKNLSHGHADTNDYIELAYILFKLNVNSKSIVDLGCGAGAAICLFKLFSFKKIYGVELNKNLSEIASKNFEERGNVKILNLDAENFKNTIDLVYIFNPFPESTLKKVINNILNGEFNYEVQL
jgi:SAM-dependent methyltransferase